MRVLYTPIGQNSFQSENTNKIWVLPERREYGKLSFNVYNYDVRAVYRCKFSQPVAR